jgi:hypothetical protein
MTAPENEVSFERSNNNAIGIYKTRNLRYIYGLETWLLRLRGENKLRTFDNKVGSTREKGTRGCGTLRN